ncbi:MAG: hypothetical protein SGBAC_010651 [Bacillariaceae sp.]
MKLKATSQSDDTPSSWNEGGKVVVRVVKEVSSGASPLEVSEAWMEHHWRRGGGLPIVVRRTESSSSSENRVKRTIYPVGMEEGILSSSEGMDSENGPEDDDAPIIIRYEVSEAGPFFADLVPGSHQGTVTFLVDTLIWEVEFETTQLCALYQSVTEFTVGVAARTVQEACGPTRLLALKARIPNRIAALKDSPIEMSPRVKSPLLMHDLRNELLDFFWTKGGGLPLIPPIPYGDILKYGGGVRSKLLRIPPLITESIVSIATDSNEKDGDTQEVAEIVYRLDDPGWLTFPFLIHTHLGRIQLISSPSRHSDDDDDDGDSMTELQWQVELRSYPLAAPVVEKLVHMTICTIVRNFLVHLEEPGATIPLILQSSGDPNNGLVLPRGINISRASWWGGVIEKLNDGRQQDADLMGRVVGILTPWTWGRTGNGVENEDAISNAWTDDERISL